MDMISSCVSAAYLHAAQPQVGRDERNREYFQGALGGIGNTCSVDCRVRYLGFFWMMAGPGSRLPVEARWNYRVEAKSIGNPPEPYLPGYYRR
jgi:hypothetical protein